MNPDWKPPESYPKLREDATIFSHKEDKVEMAISLRLAANKIDKILNEYLSQPTKETISNFNILAAAREFVNFASPGKRCVQRYGPLIFFSTRGGDAWLLHPETSRVRCIRKGGNYLLLEGIESFDMHFDGRYRFQKNGTMSVRYFFWRKKYDRLIPDDHDNPISEIRNVIEVGVPFPQHANRNELETPMYRKPVDKIDCILKTLRRKLCDLLRV